MSEDNTSPVAETPVVETPAVETKPEVPTKRKFTYKSDGADHEEELSDEEVASKLSLARAANKRMSEAATSRKQVDAFVQALKDDPMSVLENEQIMGSKKFRDIAEKFLLKQIEEESLTPAERAQAERERKLTEYERREQEQKQVESAAEAKRLEEHYTAEYEKTIIESLTSSNLPKTPYTVARMAKLMQTNLKNGYDLTSAQLASMVREDYNKEIKGVVNGMSAEQMIAMFGQDVADNIRKHDLEKFKLSKNTKPKQPSTPAEPTPTRMNSRDFTEQLKARFTK